MDQKKQELLERLKRDEEIIIKIKEKNGKKPEELSDTVEERIKTRKEIVDRMKNAKFMK